MSGTTETVLRALPSIVFAGPTADLQLLAANIRLRRWYDNPFLMGYIGDRLNRPHPTEVALFVEGPSTSTAFPDFHSPMIAVGRNCEPKRNRGCDNHSAQYSN
jgi:hypothetical protein